MSESRHCIHCRPDLYPRPVLAPQRAAPGHFSVRFGDARMFVAANGVRQWHVVECMAGPDGWALCCPDDGGNAFPSCPCGSGELCTVVVYGAVGVGSTPELAERAAR